MNEIIISIEEITNKKEGGHYGGYDGFRIHTTKQIIEIGISNEQSCCEDWGYFFTNDKPKSFYGAELYKIEVVDEILQKEKLVNTYDGGITFIDFVTSQGILQFTMYNSHNGYYSHHGYIKSIQLNGLFTM